MGKKGLTNLVAGSVAKVNGGRSSLDAAQQSAGGRDNDVRVMRRSGSAECFKARTGVQYVLKDQELLQTVYQMAVRNKEGLGRGPTL